MTTKRLVLGLATSLLVFGVGAGVYAHAQNTNQGPPPFSGRPGGRGGPGGPMGMMPMLARQLNLTDAQKAQVKSIFDSHRDEWKALGDRARTAHTALQQAVTADVVDEGLIRQRSADVAAVDADMAVARARVHGEVFQILTADQKAQAKTLQSQMQEKMKEHAGRRGRGQL